MDQFEGETMYIMNAMGWQSVSQLINRLYSRVGLHSIAHSVFTLSAKQPCKTIALFLGTTPREQSMQITI